MFLAKKTSLSLVLFFVGFKAPGLTLVPVQLLGWCGPAGHHITQPHIPHVNQQLSGPMSQLTRPSRTSTALTVEKSAFPAVPEGPGAQLLLLPKAKSKFVCQGSEEERWGWGRRGQWQNFGF